MKKKRRLKVVLFLLISFVLLGLLVCKQVIRENLPKRYSEYVEVYSEKYNLDPHLVYAVIKAESNFIENAESHKGALGLMQIMPSTAEWIAEYIGMSGFSKETLLSPKINIEMGCWYLNNLSMEFNGEMDLILAAYNGGRGNVNKWLNNREYSEDGIKLKKIPFNETNKYVTKVKIYKKLYDITYGNE